MPNHRYFHVIGGVVIITEFCFKSLDEEMSYFCGKPFQDIKRLIFMIWLLNSVALEQILEARKNKEFIQKTFRLKGSKLEKLVYCPV